MSPLNPSRLLWDRGTLLFDRRADEPVPQGFEFDPRVQMYRAEACRYHDLVLRFHRAKTPIVDEARNYGLLDRTHRTDREPRTYQREAVQSWIAAGRRGTIVLPTGSGKSFVAELCIANANRSVLIVVPTLDLVAQWVDGLKRSFGGPIGILGGGVHDVQDITVSTYDSAYIHVDKYGNRFGLLVFDEVHHLPGPVYGAAANQSIAPFRLGLTATLERPDGAHVLIDELVGPVCYTKGITELSGEFLADYETHRIFVHLSDVDRDAYDTARGRYRNFIEEQGIRLGGSGGWQRFLRAAGRSKEGRLAFKAWLESRRILQGAPAKLRWLAECFQWHPNGRILIFTSDNATVYQISRLFLVPAITHQTPSKERRSLLSAFETGEVRVLVTSRVLNEGVDLPAADVAVVLSGTGTVREHVQRLGRILRPQEGKRAVLYELVVSDSAEERTSESRRAHDAYSQGH